MAIYVYTVMHIWQFDSEMYDNCLRAGHGIGKRRHIMYFECFKGLHLSVLGLWCRYIRVKSFNYDFDQECIVLLKRSIFLDISYVYFVISVI